jgi:diacylglycerol kinase family enzyme
MSQEPRPTVLVLWNAKARHGAERASEFCHALQDAGFDIDETPGRDDPACFSETLRNAPQKVSAVAVCGGDGTLNSALEGLLVRRLPVLFVAAGTANNSARNLGLPRDVDALVELLKSKRERLVDVGFANATPFLTVCGIGLSTLVNTSVSGRVKRWLGPLAFLVQLFIVAWSSRPFRLQLSVVEGKPLECRNVHQVSVVNGRYFATGLTVTEDATLDDGTLDILCVHFRKWWHGFFSLTHFLRGTSGKLAEVTHVRTADATLFCRRGKGVDVDGDVKEQLPVRFTVKAGALRVIA